MQRIFERKIKFLNNFFFQPVGLFTVLILHSNRFLVIYLSSLYSHGSQT